MTRVFKKKALVAFLIAIQLIFAFSFVFATTLDPEAARVNNALQTYEGEPNLKSKSSKAIISISKTVLEMLQLIGIALGVIMIVVVGIKYIINPEKDKPEIRKVALNYLFGAICIFGATTILTLIQKIVIEFKRNV